MSKTVYYTKAGPISSTALSYFWYDEPNKEFYVQFHDGGRVAGYRNVGRTVVDDFLRASSKGQFYTRFIKGVYLGLSTDVDFREKSTVPSLALVDQQVFETKPKRAYKVYALIEVTEDYLADDVDDAVAAFYDDHGSDAKVSKVEVIFS
jgi:hypothetical protein